MTVAKESTPKEIHDYLPDVYTEYAMSVISDRAIPDVRDGLKPVQRRILYSMWKQGLTPDKPHKKSARTVGEVLGKYHPHGDKAVYDALVRLGQDFVMRHTLIDGQGNFGSIDGDPPAAMRYTEARLTELATEFFERLKPEGSSVDWNKNFDGSTTEPEVLPVPFPNLLVNGTSGIAVGMSTDIPPHNLSEVLDACIHLLELKQPKRAQWGTLLEEIQGPDYPTGGELYIDEEDLESLYKTGEGQFMVAGTCHKEDISPKRKAVVVEELPYSVSKSKLIDEIVELAKSDDDPGISTVRDESDRDGLRVVVECRLGRSYEVVLNNLYEKTSLKKRQRCKFLALNEGVPRQMDLMELLITYNEFMDEVLVRNTEKRKEQAEDRLHIVEGLMKALVDIDRVIEIVKQSEDSPSASQALQHEFDMSEDQAEAVLDRRIRSLTGIQQIEIEKEKEQLKENIEHYETLLDSKDERAEKIKSWYKDIKEKYGEYRDKGDQERKHTNICHESLEIDLEDLRESEPATVSIYEDGYIRRDHGNKSLDDLDKPPAQFIRTDTLKELMAFDRDGTVYSFRVSSIPDDARDAKGVPFQQINSNIDEVGAVLPSDAEQVFVLTREGYIKRMDVSGEDDFTEISKAGIKYTKLKDDDEVIDVIEARPEKHVFAISEAGKGIRFDPEDLRTMSRNARGVIAKKGEPLAGGVQADDDDYLLVNGSSTQGAIRAGDIDAQGRGGKGRYWIKPAKGEKVSSLKVSDSPTAVVDDERESFDSRSKLGGRGSRQEVDYFLLEKEWDESSDEDS